MLSAGSLLCVPAAVVPSLLLLPAAGRLPRLRRGPLQHQVFPAHAFLLVNRPKGLWRPRRMPHRRTRWSSAALRVPVVSHLPAQCAPLGCALFASFRLAWRVRGGPLLRRDRRFLFPCGGRTGRWRAARRCSLLAWAALEIFTKVWHRVVTSSSCSTMM